MKFKAIKKETVIRNPQEDMAERRIPSEIRIDPLTGRTARICHFMKLHWEKPDFEALVAGTEAWCPFCADKVLKVTPCFPADLIPEGRLQKDDMVIFPNIAPYDSLGAVATFGARHYIPMTAFEPAQMASAFGFAQDFFRRVEAAGHPESVYHHHQLELHAAGRKHTHSSPPAGLLHFLRAQPDAPGTGGLKAIWTARDPTSGMIWWLPRSKSDERYLGKIGRTHWMTAFAPMGVAGDVLAVVEDARCTLDLNGPDLLDLASGLAKVMAEYDKMGIYSFNMNFFTGAKTDDHFRFHLLFSPRTFFSQKLGTPDVGALRNLFNETLCMAYPEEIKELLRPGF